MLSNPSGLPVPDVAGAFLILGGPYSETEEEQREGHRRLGEWWRWKQYYARFDRCCHGKK